VPKAGTTILLRWLLADVPEQTAAVEALLASGVPCVVPDATLIETVYVLEKVMLLSRATITQSIEAVLAVADVEIDRVLWRTALDNYLIHPKLSITDTYLAELAHISKQVPLYTFDRKLANQLEAAELLRAPPDPSLANTTGAAKG
jgi:predicted nucleic-acid-binding protein